MTISKRALARRSLAVVVALAVTATLSVAARAQEAAAARLAISATVGAGPFLVGELIPIEVTIANTGDADATGVRASGHSRSGSDLVTQDWGELSTWPGPGITLPAGQRHVRTIHGEVRKWGGAPPLAHFSVWQGNTAVTSFDLPIAVRDPNSARDVLAGVVYGDRNGNGTPDTGEGLAGVRVTVSADGPAVSLEATTGADGRFGFADLPVQVYFLSARDVPDGWVVEGVNSYVPVDGAGSAAAVVLRGQRPLTDVLSAAMRFTRGVYAVGDRAEVEVTLTNSGSSDLTGIRATCDRANSGGPELRDLAFGDLDWDASGVTLPAGGSRVFTVSGTLSDVTAEYGAVDHLCEFGPGDTNREGRPRAFAVAKVPGPAVTFRRAFYRELDTGPEMVAGARIVLRDAVTGQFAAEGRTDAQGRVRFENLPSGPYDMHVRGSWRFQYGPSLGVLFAGTCRSCQEEGWTPLVPAPDPTKARGVAGW